MPYGSRISVESVNVWMDMLQRWINDSELGGAQKDECILSLQQIRHDAQFYKGEKIENKD